MKSNSSPLPEKLAEYWRAGRDPKRRAILSGGSSNHVVYQMIATTLRRHHAKRGVIFDVGCGGGALHAFIEPLFDRYVGIDLVRFDSFPSDCVFYPANLDDGLPFAESSADVVVAAEIIEHLENPRAFVRELARVAKPEGSIILTTPNQLSLLSLLTLIFKHRFAAFADVDYPAHLTALLEVDLIRIAKEAGLTDIVIEFSGSGRIPKTPRHYPKIMSLLWPRRLSDNLLVFGRKPRVL
jgi:2-polyprenyl-3-methyl-5-hydroxy-6-metoxy-1,4-benzoquinol methylase